MSKRIFDVISLGRLAIDLYADEIGVELARVRHFSVYAGGCPANFATGAARLGLRVAMASRIGTDGLSDGLVEFLTTEGVDTRYVARDAERLTGLAFLSILPPDTFPLIYYRPDPADMHMTPEDMAEIDFEEADALFVAGTRFSGEPARSAALAAMERARAAGTRVALDIDCRPTLWRDPGAFGKHLREALPLADVVMGTEEEIMAAADQSGVEEAVPALLDLAQQAVAVKRGANGSEVHTKEGDVCRARPFSVKTLNVLGAGDAWAAGFVYAWLQGWPWKQCARFGNAAGAIVVTRHACANDMPRREEVAKFIAQQGGL